MQLAPDAFIASAELRVHSLFECSIFKFSSEIGSVGNYQMNFLLLD